MLHLDSGDLDEGCRVAVRAIAVGECLSQPVAAATSTSSSSACNGATAPAETSAPSSRRSARTPLDARSQ